MLRPEDLPYSTGNAFALDVLEGLSGRPKQIPSVYFYDEQGSALFNGITQLEEYYLTDCEAEILRDNGELIARSLSAEPFNLLELGAGDGRKTLILLENFIRCGLRVDYMPLDVSEQAMRDLLERMKERLPRAELKITGVVAEYFQALKWLNRRNGKRNVVLFLGSNIGNFDRTGALRFLHHLWNTLGEGDLLFIGFDLKKEIEVMERAYNDSMGVTREFNLNLLTRINRELGGNFDLEKFAFCSRYNVSSGAVESWLVSKEAHQVHLKNLGRTFSFDLWEGIHTENSHKFSISEIEALASQTGFTVEGQFFDSKNYFVDSLWRVNKSK